MIKEYDYAEGIPFVALLLVAEYFGRERIDFVEDVSRPNIGGGGKLTKRSLIYCRWHWSTELGRDLPKPSLGDVFF